MNAELRKILKALNAINADGFQRKAAIILLAVNGFENAMEYIRACKKNQPDKES